MGSRPIFIHDDFPAEGLFFQCGALVGATADTRWEGRVEISCRNNVRKTRHSFEYLPVPGDHLRALPLVVKWYSPDTPFDEVFTEVAPYYGYVFFGVSGRFTPERAREIVRVEGRLIADLGHWLDQRQVRWTWGDWSTGRVYDGPDRYEYLRDTGEA